MLELESTKSHNFNDVFVFNRLWITDVYHLVNGSILDVTDWSLIYPIPQVKLDVLVLS